ncbi:MAG TPA: FAD-binding oxidoreductase [Gammaproteobacteria bacterium]|nr:FAD-binding oxidoreductase [Gammaproteobacteria bacterium]
MSTPDTRNTYSEKAARLTSNWQSGAGHVRLAKSTISNLFRYEPRGAAARRISLRDFNHVLAVDADARTVEVEGLTTYETVVRACLARGFLPLVAPELKHITVGGATVGIGIESTCFRYGFVHDGLIEADVLLPSGQIVTARADNAYADLFNALPNSYGTLGYILRAKIKLQPAKSHVHLHMQKFHDIAPYLEAMRVATKAEDLAFVEGLFFEDRRYFLMTGRFVDKPGVCDDIVRENVFYRLVERRRDIYLTTFDYIFRYDPDWFWNVPENGFYKLFRRFAPESWRNSAFYTKYVATKNKLLGSLGVHDAKFEPLIQDWEVPWANAEELIRFCLAEVDLEGRPWAAVPIVAPRQPTLYPIRPNELYFNLGCYLQVRRPEGKPPYHYTKIVDRKCFELGGIKMLYSSSFLSEPEFDALYNGAAYRTLKAKYDAAGNAQTLYKKVALAPT